MIRDSVSVKEVMPAVLFLLAVVAVTITVLMPLAIKLAWWSAEWWFGK
jgi:hypothetical protein